tara:strand:+ start:20 stop:364 length:345 start_codon:yes stop_codon:yes gene_type:complete
MGKLTLLTIPFVILVTGCTPKTYKIESNKEKQIEIKKNVNMDKKTQKLKFKCTKDLISSYTNSGWKVIKKKEKKVVCSWKSIPANSRCDINNDKGCKITLPDKYGMEIIYIIEY